MENYVASFLAHPVYCSGAIEWRSMRLCLSRSLLLLTEITRVADVLNWQTCATDNTAMMSNIDITKPLSINLVRICL